MVSASSFIAMSRHPGLAPKCLLRLATVANILLRHAGLGQGCKPVAAVFLGIVLAVVWTPRCFFVVDVALLWMIVDCCHHHVNFSDAEIMLEHAGCIKGPSMSYCKL